MKTLYLECNMGAAGDMLTAALYELMEEDVRAQFLRTMNALLPGVRVEALPAVTCGVAGTRIRVTVDGLEEDCCDPGHDHHHGHDHDHEHDHDHDHVHDHEHHDHDHHDHDHGHTHHHHHADPGHIAQLIGGLPLPEQVRSHARGVYDAIALAEAGAHGCPVGDVHFHEVGALDAVADVAGVCYALYLLGPEKIAASPVHVGSGQVRCAHGVMPVPAPATARLLSGIPSYGGEIRGELCTPTGAALLAHFAASFGPMPALAVEKVGYGVGKKEFEAANCVRAFWGDGADGADVACGANVVSGADAASGANGAISELVCNLDDMTPEAVSYACRALLELGALDVYTVPGQMKKGRPGWVLTALCAPEREGELARHILAQTATNGLRVRRCGKYFLTPAVETVDTKWGPVRFKTAEGWGISHRKPEYEDAARIAREYGLPLGEVMEELNR